MSIARRWVFPILRLILFAAIAAALVKVAFFADPVVSDAVQPTGTIVEPQIAATIGTIKNDVTVQGSVVADTPIPIKATLAGVVREVMVSAGQQVDVGTEILRIRSETANPDGTPLVKYETVLSPAVGVLSSLGALVGQTFVVGDDIGKVSPATFSVSGPIAPEQQYRLLNRPTEAQITISGGPAPFTCSGVTIGAPTTSSTPVAPGSPATPTDPSAGSGGPTVRCAVPAEITVFAGLTAKIVLAGGTATDVLIVPTTAVQGSAQTGTVYLAKPDGSSEPIPVTLGITDGKNVEITGGLEKGQQILQFIPGAPAVDPNACLVDPTAAGCGG